MTSQPNELVTDTKYEKERRRTEQQSVNENNI